MPTWADDPRQVGRVDERRAARRTYTGSDRGDAIDRPSVDRRILDKRTYAAHVCIAN